MKNKKGFTLVELLAVIVILAIILVIAVPKVLNVISDATLNSFQSSIKMIASSAEREYQVNSLKDTPGTMAETCSTYADIDTGLAATCSVAFDDGVATVTVTTVGFGKFKGCAGVGTRAAFTTTPTC